MINLLLKKGVSIDVNVRNTHEGDLLVTLDRQARITGKLVGIEKRGQAFTVPTVVIKYGVDGNPEWEYFYDWALDKLELKKKDDGFVLTNKPTY